MTHTKIVWRTGPTSILSCEHNGLRLVVRRSGIGESIRYTVERQPGLTNPISFILTAGVEATAIEAMFAAERYASLWQRAGLAGAPAEEVEFA